MPKLAIAVAISLLVGVAVGAWFKTGEPAGSDTLPASSTSLAGAATLGDRIGILERDLEEERNAREVLEEQLLSIFEQLDGHGMRSSSARERPTSSEAAIADSQTAGRIRQRDPVARMRIFQERRIAQLVEGGIPEVEAKRLLKLESDAQFEVMQAVYEAQRSGDRFDPFSNILNTQAILRNKIGDAEYERFLIAQGRRTNVQIASVLDGSPGSRAGLRPGDEIISYNGERTFSMTELRQLTIGGEAGELAIVEFDRDGVRMQLSIPRGPIGMNGNGASVRTMNWWGG